MDAFRRWFHIPETLFDIDLAPEEKPEFEALLSAIRDRRDLIPARRAERHQELLIFNRGGSKPPIFWCFNNWAEPQLLAYQLDSDQPLIAAQSLHEHEDRWVKKARYTEPLARRYLDGVRELFGDQIPLLGGNCQGAPVAESMAIQLAEQTGAEPRLVTLEYMPKRQYQGPILMLFGETSVFNPFRYERDPIPYWERRLKTYKWAFLPAMHGGYFREPGIKTLAAHVLQQA